MPQLFTRALQSSAEEGDGHEGKEKTVRGGKKDEKEMDLSFFFFSPQNESWNGVPKEAFLWHTCESVVFLI